MLEPFSQQNQLLFCEHRFLPVIGVSEIMYHMAVSSRKAAGGEV